MARFDRYKKRPVKIVEAFSGRFFYHLSDSDIHSTKYQVESFCGLKKVMVTNIPLSYWGKRSQLKEQYCDLCGKIAEVRKVEGF